MARTSGSDEYHERAVVGKILLDPACLDEAGLTDEHFFNLHYKEIIRAIKRLGDSNHEIDPITVADAIPEQTLKAMGGISYISGLVADVSVTSNIIYHANKIRDRWLQRKCHGITARLAGCQTGEDMVESMRSLVEELEVVNGHALPTMAEEYERELADIEGHIRRVAAGEDVILGLQTGLGLDRVVPGGFPIDKVITIFGESGNFKTTTKNNIVRGIAKFLRGTGSVLDISLEDTDRLTTQRFIAGQTGLNYGKIATRQLSDDDLARIRSVRSDALDVVNGVIMGGRLPPDMDSIVRAARRYKRSHNCKAVVVDYLQLMDTSRCKDIKQPYAEIIKEAQRAAKRDQMAYIFVSQVTKEVDRRARDSKSSSRPSANDMMGGSWMKFGSKLSIGVYRPFKYEPVPKTPRRKSDPDYTVLYQTHKDGPNIYRNVMELWVQKNVLGEAEVVVPCLVQPQTGRMIPMPEEVKRYIR